MAEMHRSHEPVAIGGGATGRRPGSPGSQAAAPIPSAQSTTQTGTRHAGSCRWPGVGLLMAAVLAVAAPAKREELFNVDVFFGWDGHYRPMAWTPVEVNIDTELTKPFEGILTLSASQDGLNRMHVRHRFVVTPDNPVRIPLVLKFAFAAERCQAEIRNMAGRVEWSNTFNLWDPSLQARMLTTVQENDLLVGVVGERKFGLLQVAKQTACRCDRGVGKVYIADKLTRSAPWDWTGYTALDLLVLYDPDWSRFSSHQVQAITDYVANGGALLIVLGTYELDTGGPIGRILPAAPAPAQEVTLEADILGRLGLDASAPETVAVRPLELRDDVAGLEAVRTTRGDLIAAVAYVGFGRVGILGFDPSTLSDRQRQASTAFWVRCFRDVLEERRLREHYPPLKGRIPAGFSGNYQGMTSSVIDSESQSQDIPLRRSIFQVDPNQDADDEANEYGYQSYAIGYARANSNAIMEHLYSIAEMRPLSIWWVILLLTLLAILLGPVDYIVLKRMGRLPLTWLTSLGWILLFSIGAYYGVEALRGGNCQFRLVAVTDSVAGTGRAWRTEYVGIFAPRSGDYRFEPLDATLETKPWWSGIAPTEQWLHWYSRQPGMRDVICLQQDGANVPLSVPISIWTIQTMMCERPVPNREIEATLRRNGSEYTLMISNLSDRPIDGGYVLVDTDLRMPFGSIPPWGVRTFTGRAQPFAGWTERIRRRGSSSGLTAHEVPYGAEGVLPRTQTIRGYLAHGAAVVCAYRHTASVPYRIPDRSYQADSLELIRHIVFPVEAESGS